MHLHAWSNASSLHKTLRQQKGTFNWLQRKIPIFQTFSIPAPSSNIILNDFPKLGNPKNMNQVELLHSDHPTEQLTSRRPPLDMSFLKAHKNRDWVKITTPRPIWRLDQRIYGWDPVETQRMPKQDWKEWIFSQQERDWQLVCVSFLLKMKANGKVLDLYHDSRNLRSSRRQTRQNGLGWRIFGAFSPVPAEGATVFREMSSWNRGSRSRGSQSLQSQLRWQILQVWCEHRHSYW